MKEKIQVFIHVTVPIVASLFIIYCLYWIAKNGSYFFFYESMVQDTIREMVKPEYLIKE